MSRTGPARTRTRTKPTRTRTRTRTRLARTRINITNIMFVLQSLRDRHDEPDLFQLSCRPADASQLSLGTIRQPHRARSQLPRTISSPPVGHQCRPVFHRWRSRSWKRRGGRGKGRRLAAEALAANESVSGVTQQLRYHHRYGKNRLTNGPCMNATTHPYTQTPHVRFVVDLL